MRKTLALLALLACGDTFDPPSEIATVRILAVQSSAPYASPGETVTLRTLAVDGRADKTVPMNVFYLPELCIDPPAEAPINCEVRWPYPKGVVLNDRFTRGETGQFVAPPLPEGNPLRVVYAYVIACAGSLQYTDVDPAYPKAPPFGCFDPAGNRLGARDFVVATARTYVVNGPLRNLNPEIESVLAAGAVLSPAAPLRASACAKVPRADHGTDADTCKRVKIDTRVPARSQEVDVLASTPQETLKEQITVDYFATGGEVDRDRTILYLGTGEAVGSTEVEYRPPERPGDYTLFAVVRDGRGGVQWTSAPIQVR
jgi:hypothetical protein